MPETSKRAAERFDAVDPKEDGQLPYLSKSRVMTWIKNPEHFRLKYVEKLRSRETDAMVRGSRIHKAFEKFYLQEKWGGPEVMDNPQQYLPANRQLWADFTEPYISNFFIWEQRRLDYAQETGSDWAPLSVEEEHWREPRLGLPNEPEWMGFADVILPAGSVPEIEADEGAVVVDFKTGSVPDEQYRDEGIHTELEYYTMLFDDKYDVVGSMIYYPQSNEAVVQPDDDEYQDNIEMAVAEILEHVASDRDHYPTNPGPLCGWDTDPDCRSEYYGLCPCTWNVPADNSERFLKLEDRGLSAEAIANKMGTTPDAVRYWKYKFDLW